MTTLPSAGAPVTDILQTIETIVVTELDRDIDPAIDVFDQGATSMSFIRIVAQINEAYGIALDVGELEEASVDALSELVVQQRQSHESVTARDWR